MKSSCWKLVPRITPTSFYGLFVVSCCLCRASTEAFIRSPIEARTLAEFTTVGWTASPNTQPFIKPSDWIAALQPLDEGVTGGGVWRVTSNPTRFKFKRFTGEDRDFCEVKNVKLIIRYFSNGAVMLVFPCITGYCYVDPDPSLGVAWITKEIDIDYHRIAGTEIDIHMQVLPGARQAHIFFDYIIIEHDGIDCSSTTTTTTIATEAPTSSKASSTTEVPTTIEDTETPIDEETPTPTTVTEDGSTTHLTTEGTTEEAETTITTDTPGTEEVEPTQTDTTTQTSTSGMTSSEYSTVVTTEEFSTATPETTTSFPECPTTPPEPCGCCDRCTQKQPQEIHYHNHYYYSQSAPTIDAHPTPPAIP